jgi:hypothetical protein
MTDPEEHWLARPGTIRVLWLVLAGVLIVTVAAELFIDVKGAFTLDRMFAFAALFGFFSCVAMVFGSKLLGAWVKRDESYYDDDDGGRS